MNDFFSIAEQQYKPFTQIFVMFLGFIELLYSMEILVVEFVPTQLFESFATNYFLISRRGTTAGERTTWLF